VAFGLETKSQREREKSKEHIWIGKVKKLEAGGRKKAKESASATWRTRDELPCRVPIFIRAFVRGKGMF